MINFFFGSTVLFSDLKTTIVKVDTFMINIFSSGFCLCHLFLDLEPKSCLKLAPNLQDANMSTKLRNVTFSKHFLWMTFQKFRPYIKRNCGSQLSNVYGLKFWSANHQKCLEKVTVIFLIIRLPRGVKTTSPGPGDVIFHFQSRQLHYV